MNKLTFILLFLSLLGFSQKKDKKGNVFTNTGDAAKLVVAKQKLYAGDYVGALNAYREVEYNSPNDASVKYYVGLCYFNLKQIEKSKETLLAAVQINKDVKPETHLLLGKIYQLNEDYNMAIDEAAKYKAEIGRAHV